MLRQQHMPVRPFAPDAAHDPLAPTLEGDPVAGAPECVGSGIDRVRQYMMHRVVDRRLPDDPAALRPIFDGRQCDRLLSQPQMDLPDALILGEFAKHESDRLPHPQVWITFNPVMAPLDEPDGHREEQFAAARLPPQRLERTLPQDGQLHLAHRALHAEQQSIIGETRVV